jgi:hypothetical protein
LHGIKKYEVRVVTNGIKFIESFFKTGGIIQKLKEGQFRQHSDLISPLAVVEGGM